jgi:hypothetical protein
MSHKILSLWSVLVFGDDPPLGPHAGDPPTVEGHYAQDRAGPREHWSSAADALDAVWTLTDLPGGDCPEACR